MITRFFVQKAWLAGSALVIGLLGMAFERRWLVWVAVALLSGAVILRLIERRLST
jgi:hypothetical protein